MSVRVTADFHETMQELLTDWNRTVEAMNATDSNAKAYCEGVAAGLARAMAILALHIVKEEKS